MNCVQDLIAKHEGRVATVYLDSLGIPTVGIGHNLKACPLPTGWVTPLTDAQIDQLFATDLAKAREQVVQNIPWFFNLDEVRQAVILDMAFNMGINKVMCFVRTLGFIERGDWANAANGMLQSVWAEQVGARAREDAQMMLTGQWPEG